MKRILFLTNLSTPYRVDFYNELGKITDLTVIFEARRSDSLTYNWNDDSITNFKAIFLNKGYLNEKKINFSILQYLKKEKYDAIVVSCYYTWTEMLALLYMKLRRISYCFETDGGMISTNESFLVKQIKRFLIGGAVTYFSPSKGSDEYLAYYGASGPIRRYPFTSLSRRDILPLPDSNEIKKAFKQKLGISEEKVILAVGQFIHRKGFDILLRSCALLDAGNVGVYFVGGIPTEEYIALKKQFGLTHVHFAGFKTKEELAEWFRAADIFALPTREDIWGLVINEAMAYGLPVVTTDRCVAGVELISDPSCILPVGDVKALADILNKILTNEEYARQLSEENLRNISMNTFENMADAHVKSIQ